MRRVALLYNPVSGTRQRKRVRDVEAAAQVFREHGMETRSIATESPGSAGKQALQAIRDGADAILCCGGDGTIHDVAQALVPARALTPVGVIPLGTGNGLAAELGMSRDPAHAAWEMARFEPRRIAVGKITWGSDEPRMLRYFLISAGIGADAEMLYRLNTEDKAKYGLLAYYAHAMRLFWTHRFAPIDVEYRVAGESEPRREVVSQLLAGRIERFGGVVSRLTPGGSLESDTMQLVLFRSPARWPMAKHATAAVFRGIYRGPLVEHVAVSEVRCRLYRGQLPAAWQHAKLATRVYSQADGELLGGPPVEMTMVPDALTLLMPRRTAE